MPVSGDFCGFVGRSAVMQTVYSQIRDFANAPLPVLVVGETGTGKDLVASAIQTLASKGRPFELANCAALPEPLIDSELFGHVKRAFTGALKDHRGLIRRADGGMLFLDEIGELPLFSQAKLLHCVETGQFRPVGGERLRRSSFRLIAATNRDLGSMVTEGSFRADLRYRLGAAMVRLPPLRERIEDLPLLAELFLGRYRAKLAGFGPSGISARAMARLMHCRWPGNVRQLKHVVETAAAMTRTPTVSLESVEMVLDEGDRKRSSVQTLEEALAAAERKAIDVALRASHGNREKAAEILGVSQATLYRKLATHRTETVSDSQI